MQRLKEDKRFHGDESTLLDPRFERRRSSIDVLPSAGSRYYPKHAGLAVPEPIGSPVHEWISRMEGRSPIPRPASTSSHGPPHRPFEDLFPAVIPPSRPSTPSPAGDALKKSAVPKSRKSSEAVALERIFQDFSIGSSPTSSAEQTQELHVGGSPLQSAAVTSNLSAQGLLLDQDSTFKSDLANVLVWFQNNLNSSQKITTAFTLLNHLTTWQLRFILSLLSKPSEDHFAEAQLLNSSQVEEKTVGAPPGFYRNTNSIEDNNTVTAESNSETATMESTINSPSHSSVSIITSPVQTDLTLDQCYPSLFDRDISSWLRALRLHKYSATLSTLKQSDLLAMCTGPDGDIMLEELGVSALGARRKILRVLTTIRESR